MGDQHKHHCIHPEYACAISEPGLFAADLQESQANPEDNMSPADVQSHVQRRVRRIAEQAFWDSVQATLADSASGVSQQHVTGQLAGLLAHMGQELMAVLPEQATAAREQLAAELDESRLQEALTAHQVSHHL